MEYSYYGGWHDLGFKPKRGLQYMAIDYHLEKIIQGIKDDYKSLRESINKQHEREVKTLETRYGDQIKAVKNRLSSFESQIKIIKDKLPELKVSLDSMKDGIAMLIEMNGNATKIIEQVAGTV